MSKEPRIPQRVASLQDPLLQAHSNTEEGTASLKSSLKSAIKMERLAHQSQVFLKPSVHPQWWVLMQERVEWRIAEVDIHLKQAKRDMADGKIEEKVYEEKTIIYHKEMAKHSISIINILQRKARLSLNPEFNTVFVELFERQIFPHDKLRMSSFKKALVEAYSAQKPDDDNRFWCPIIKTYSTRTQQIAAHLFPLKLGQEAMDLIFGPAPSQEYEINGAKNGLLLEPHLEKQFDYFNIVIVPHSEGNGRCVLRVLNHALMKEVSNGRGKEITYRELDNEELEFKSDFRPGARFL